MSNNELPTYPPELWRYPSFGGIANEITWKDIFIVIFIVLAGPVFILYSAIFHRGTK